MQILTSNTCAAKARIKLSDQTLSLVKNEVSQLQSRGAFSSGVRATNIDFFMALLEGGFFPLESVYDGSMSSALSPTVYVDWGHAVIAENSCLLATNGLGSCASLKLTGSMEYLLHALSNSTSAEVIEKSLRESKNLGLDFSNAEIGIMPGSTLDTKAPINMVEALSRIDPSLLDKVSLIRDFNGRGQGLALKDGETFRYGVNWHSDETFSCRTVSHYHSMASIGGNGFQELI